MKTLNPFNAALIAALVVLAIISINLYFKNIAIEKVLKRPIAELRKENEKVKEYIDKAGAVHTVYRDRIITKRDLALPSNKTYTDSIAKALNIQASQIKESAKIIGMLKGRVKAYQVKYDSLQRRTYFFQQRYLTANFTEADSTLTYAYNGEINTVRYAGKRNLFGIPKEYLTDISSPDSNFTISGLKQFTLSEPVKKKPWSIGLQAGYYYDPIRNDFFKGFGIGLGYGFSF